MVWVRFLHSRDSYINVLKTWQKEVERESRETVKTIRSNKAKELVQGEAKRYCDAKGIHIEDTARY